MIKTYLDLPDSMCTFEKSKVVILPVAYEGTVSYGKGTAKGPEAIIDATPQLEGYDEELDREVYYVGINIDKQLSGFKTPKEMIDKVERRVRELVDAGKFVVMLGGEHSISGPVIKAHKKKYPDLCVLQIDAHSDLREEYEDSKLSHASVMKRVFDMGCKIVSVGIRAQCVEERKHILDNPEKLKVYYAKDIREEDDSWFSEVLDSLGDHVYVSFDVDGLDPSEMMATGTPVPGGLRWKQVMRLLKLIGEKKKVVGCDLVELAPIKDFHGYEFTAALTLQKMIGYFVLDK